MVVSGSLHTRRVRFVFLMICILRQDRRKREYLKHLHPRSHVAVFVTFTRRVHNFHNVSTNNYHVLGLPRNSLLDKKGDESLFNKRRGRMSLVVDKSLRCILNP